MNRRFLALALAGTLSLSLLAGCGSSKEPAPESSAPGGGVPLRLPGGVPVPRPAHRQPGGPPRDHAPRGRRLPPQAPSAAPSAKPSAPAATPANAEADFHAYP